MRDLLDGDAASHHAVLLLRSVPPRFCTRDYRGERPPPRCAAYGWRRPGVDRARPRRTDQHLLPFSGRIKWPAVMQALRDVDYRGPFSLEVHNAFHPLPEELKDTQLRFASEICTYLVNQAGTS